MKAGKGQTTLEMTAALVVLMMLLVASARVFVWVNERMVYRQSEYERTRITAGSQPLANVDLFDNEIRGYEIDESSNPALNIFR